MTLPVSDGAVNSVDLHPADIDRIETSAEVRAHLDAHADGTVQLRPAQVVCLTHRLRHLEGVERIAAAQPARPVAHHLAPSPPPKTKKRKTTTTRRRQPDTTPTTTPRYSTDRMSDVERLAGLDRWYRYVASDACTLSPGARAAWPYLWWHASADHCVRTTGPRIGHIIGQKRDSGRRALDELMDAVPPLASRPKPGSNLARTLDDALAYVIVHLPTL